MKIEIFQPFGEAFELMKSILFKPFDLKKWFVIGFAAFLSGHFGGAFNFASSFGDFGSHRTDHNIAPPNLEQWKPWLPVVIVAFFLVVFAIALVLTWVKARGNFIFTDCIVRNRAAIVAPWREYRKEGNSYFLFLLGMMLVAMVLIGIMVFLFFVLGMSGHGGTMSIRSIVLFVCLFGSWGLIVGIISVIVYFMAPVMYRQRCSAIEAFRVVIQLILGNIASFILFCLFALVLFMALAIVATIVTCATCCLAAVPYLGTVILLPAFVWLRAFALLFLRQFGPEYDVWAGLPPAEPTVAPPPLPA